MAPIDEETRQTMLKIFNITDYNDSDDEYQVDEKIEKNEEL